MNLLQQLWLRAQQESQALEQGRLGTGPDPNSGPGVNLPGGRLNVPVLAGLHALGLLQEGAANVAESTMGTIGGLGVGGPQAIYYHTHPNATPDAADQHYINAYRLVQEGHPIAANQELGQANGFVNAIGTAAVNPLNLADPAASLPGPLGALGRIGHLANEAPVLPLKALLAAKRAEQGARGAAAGEAVLRALLGGPAPATDAAAVVRKAIGDVPVESPTPLGPDLPGVQGPPQPGRKLVPDTTLPETPYTPGNVPARQGPLGPALPPEQGPLLPPEYGPAFPERGNVPRRLLDLIGGKRQLGPPVPPVASTPATPPALPATFSREPTFAYGPPAVLQELAQRLGVTPRTQDPQELLAAARGIRVPEPPTPPVSAPLGAPAATLADFAAGRSATYRTPPALSDREGTIRALANGPLDHLNAVLRSLHDALYPGQSADFAIPALTGQPKSAFRTSLLTDHPDGNAAEPYLDYLLNRVQRDPKAAGRLAAANPTLAEDIATLAPNALDTTTHKAQIQALFKGVGETAAPAAASATPGTEADFRALLDGPWRVSQYVPEANGVAKRLGVDEPTARTFIDNAIKDGTLARSPQGDLTFAPHGNAPVPAELPNVDITQNSVPPISSGVKRGGSVSGQEAFYAALRDQPITIDPTNTTVDWGTLRGQGKRGSGQVLGGMRDSTLQGKKTYRDLFGNLPEAADTTEAGRIARLEQNALEPPEQEAYLRARSFGLDHDGAMRYVAELTGDAPAGSTYQHVASLTLPNVDIPGAGAIPAETPASPLAVPATPAPTVAPDLAQRAAAAKADLFGDAADVPKPIPGGYDPAAGGGGGGMGLLPYPGGLTGPVGRAIIPAAGAGIGGGVGALTGDNPEDARANALKGAAIGAAVGGAAEVAPEVAHLLPHLAAATDGTWLSGTMLARAWRAGERAQAAAVGAAGAKGVGGFVKAMPGAWRAQAVNTIKQLPQDALNQAVTLWGIARDEFGIGDGDIRYWQDHLSAERDARAASLQNPVTDKLRQLGLQRLLDADAFGTVYGTDFLSSERAGQPTLNAKQSSAMGAIFSGYNGLPSINPLTIGAGAVKGRFQPFINGFVQFANGVQHDAFRYAMADATLRRDIPPLADALIADLNARGVNTAPLAARGGFFSGADVARVAGPALGRQWDQLLEETVRNGGDRIAFLAGDFRNKLGEGYPGQVSLAGKALGRVEQTVGKAIPFIRWPIHYGPVLAEIALEHPRVATVAAGLLAQQQAQAQQLIRAGAIRADEAGSQTISTETPVLGAYARLRLGGQAGTVRANPLGAVLPYTQLLGGVQLPTNVNATGYERANAVLSAAGMSPNPAIQAVAYATGNDTQAPGALSRTSGLEGLVGLLPGGLGSLSVPSLGAGLDAARQVVTGQQTSEYDPAMRRYAELVLDKTGKPLSHPDNLAYLRADTPAARALFDQAKREVLVANAVGNATSLTSPVSATAHGADAQAIAEQRRMLYTPAQMVQSSPGVAALMQQANARYAAAHPAIGVNPATGTPVAGSAAYAGASNSAREQLLLGDIADRSPLDQYLSAQTRQALLARYQYAIRNTALR